MSFSGLLKIALPFALLTLAPGCGGDEPAGDGDGDTSSGGQGTGSGGGEPATGGTTTGGSSSGGNDGTGGGEFILGSGTVSLSFNGTPVEFEVYRAVDLGGNLGLNILGSSDNESITSTSISIIDPAPGTYDCTDEGEAFISVQALDSEDKSTSFESRGTSSCTITLTEVGGPGKPLRGTFSGELQSFLDEVATVENGVIDIIQGTE